MRYAVGLNMNATGTVRRHAAQFQACLPDGRQRTDTASACHATNTRDRCVNVSLRAVSRTEQGHMEPGGLPIAGCAT